MNVARHRIAATAILVCGSLALVAVGRTMIQDSPEVATLRKQLDGEWVATRVEATDRNVAEGTVAARTTVEFSGSRVRFKSLIDTDEAEGTYVIDPSTVPGKVDFKVDAGWILGIYSLQGDRLTLCVNALKLPEQLGVPTRGRPDGLRPSLGRFVYEFRKATP